MAGDMTITIPLKMHFDTEEEYRDWLIRSLRAQGKNANWYGDQIAQLLNEAARYLEEGF